jgi:hypothetical protein
MTLNQLDTKSTVATNWIIAVSITVFVFPFLALLSVITVIPLVITLIPLFAGAPYFAFVAIYSAVRRKSNLPIGFDPDEKVLQFGTLRQQMTFLTNVILVINLVGWAFVWELGPTGTIAFVVYTLTGFFGILSIVINVPLIYGKFYWSERFAKQEHIGQWKLIRASRIMCWFVWSVYAAISFAAIFADSLADIGGQVFGVPS